MQQLHPRAVWFFFLKSAWVWLVVVILLRVYIKISLLGFYVAESQVLPVVKWLWWGTIPVLVVLFIAAKLTYRYYRYELTDTGFKKESGIIWKLYVTIPYARIQNIDIYRGVLARCLGLSDLQIQTAGQSSVGRYGQASFAEGRLLGLSQGDAEGLRNELIRRATQAQQGV